MLSIIWQVFEIGLMRHIGHGVLHLLKSWPRFCICASTIIWDRVPLGQNGPEFSAQFHWHVQDQGIHHVYIKPRTPRLWQSGVRPTGTRLRIDEEEFYRLLEGVVIEDVGGFNHKLQEWESFYNYDRPHSALGGHSPYERLRQKAAITD